MRKNQYKSTSKQGFLRKIPADSLVIGVDEAGRGAWAGPVVAAYVAWNGRNPIRSLLRDSKKMNAKTRQETYEEILQLEKKGKLKCGIGIISNAVIDTVGIREANRLAMLEALQTIKKEKLKKKNRGFLLIDGRDNYFFDIPDLPVPEYIVRGDSLVPQIMAASILAKVTRDRIMTDYEALLLGYGFAQHK